MRRRVGQHGKVDGFKRLDKLVRSVEQRLRANGGFSERAFNRERAILADVGREDGDE